MSEDKRLPDDERIRRGMEKNLYRLSIARSDVTAALYACEELGKLDMSHNLYFPTFYGMIVSYGRPFSENKPYGPLQSKWHKFKHPAHREAHEYALHLRDKSVAHSDQEIRKVYIFPPGTPMLDDGSEPTRGLGIAIRTEVTAGEWLRHFHGACYDLGGRLNDAANHLLGELYGDGSDLPEGEFELLPQAE